MDGCFRACRLAVGALAQGDLLHVEPAFARSGDGTKKAAANTAAVPMCAIPAPTVGKECVMKHCGIVTVRFETLRKYKALYDGIVSSELKIQKNGDFLFGTHKFLFLTI